jgi:hypothetical protein
MRRLASLFPSDATAIILKGYRVDSFKKAS